MGGSQNIFGGGEDPLGALLDPPLYDHFGKAFTCFKNNFPPFFYKEDNLN